MKMGSVLEPGAVLSFMVVIGLKFVVPPYSKISQLQQPVEEDSHKELEYLDTLSGISSKVDKSNVEIASQVQDTHSCSALELGMPGFGYTWSKCEGAHEEEWRHSVASIPADKIYEAIKTMEDDLELTDDGSIIALSGELKPDSKMMIMKILEMSPYYFEKEVEPTFLRAVDENIQEDHVILEITSLICVHQCFRC